MTGKVVPLPGTAHPALAPGRRNRASKRTGHKTLAVYERIREMAISYRIRPGESINEIQLARDLEASRSNVREALSRLVAEHFLVFVPNRGFFGRLLDQREVFDLYELRAYVEAAGLELALARASDGEIQAVRAFWQDVMGRVRGLGDEELLRLDEEMHLRLARLSGNEELVRALEGINARIHYVRWLQLAERRGATYEEHGKLLDALARRDALAAKAILASHVSRRRDEISQVVEAGTSRLQAGRVN